MNNFEKYNNNWDYLTPEKDNGSSRTCSGSLEARPFDQQLGEEDPAAWWYFDSLLGVKFKNWKVQFIDRVDPYLEDEPAAWW